MARFTNKPERAAGALETRVFATGAGFRSGAVWLGEPNAVLTGQTARGTPITIVLTLYTPAYTNDSAVLTYKARNPTPVLAAHRCGLHACARKLLGTACTRTKHNARMLRVLAQCALH